MDPYLGGEEIMWKEKKRDEESEGFGRYAGRCDCAEFDSGSAFLGWLKRR